MDKIASELFFKIWVETVQSRQHFLLSIWRKNKEFTKEVKGDGDSIIKEIAGKLNLVSYPGEYYHLDAVLYQREDLVPCIDKNQFWLRNIRVAFEHENYYNRKLYQEISHLLITNCDLRILVSYPYDEEYSEDLEYFHEIIKGNPHSNSFSNDESFLLIFGSEINFKWEGFVYKQEGWKRMT